MKIIKNGFIIGDDVYGEVKHSIHEEDEYGRQGVIINDDGSYTKYDFGGLDFLFRSSTLNIPKKVVPPKKGFFKKLFEKFKNRKNI